MKEIKFLIYYDEENNPTGYQSFMSIDGLEQNIVNQLVDKLPKELEATPNYNVRMKRGDVIADEIKQLGYSIDTEIALIKDAINSILNKQSIPIEYIQMESERQKIKNEVDKKYNGKFII